MTLARSFGLAMVAALVSGCFVGSELDNAKRLSEGPKKPGENPPAAAPSGSPKQIASAKTAAAQGPSWWETARSLGSEDSKVDIVACKVSGRLEFMERDDCLSRGGVTE